MTSPLFALSIHKFVSSVGDYIGFASLLAVALLVILYFAHARETATLRERLLDANDRIARLETRVGQLLQVQSLRAQQGAPQQPSVVGPPRVLRTGVTAVGPRGGAGGASSGLGQLVGGPAGIGDVNGDGGFAVSAPAGVGAPALASATKMVSTVIDPSALTASTPDEIGALAADSFAPTAATSTIPTAASTGESLTSTDGGSFDDDDDELGDTNVELPAVDGAEESTVAPAIVANPFGRGPSASSGLPRVQLRSSEDDDGETAFPRRAIPLPESGRRSKPRRGLRNVVGVLVALVIIGAVVFALVKLTSSGTSSKSQKQVAVKTTTTAPTTFNPAKVRVAVLNGTAMAGLAKDVSNLLVKKGYARANVTNGPNQTQVTTMVSYVPGEAAAAKHVAAALGLAASVVAPATSAVIQACATSPTSTAGSTAGACHGDVIVTVGSDQEKLAGSGTGSGG